MEKKNLIIIASSIAAIILVALIVHYATYNEPATEKVTKETAEKASKPQPMVKIEVIKEGEGDKVVGRGDHVTFNYRSMLVDGTIVDDSYERGASFTGQLNRMMNIKGWDEGMVGMKVGEIRKLTIPPELAYGEVGAGSKIPPNATIISEIELISFE